MGRETAIIGNFYYHTIASPRRTILYRLRTPLDGHHRVQTLARQCTYHMAIRIVLHFDKELLVL